MFFSKRLAIFFLLFFFINLLITPFTLAAVTINEHPSAQLEVTYPSPLGAPGRAITSFTELIRHFLVGVQSIVGWLAVIMIVVGGLVYLTSAGRSSQIELGKKILTYALIGFALAVAAPSILKELVDLIGTGQGTGEANVVSRATPLTVILGRILRWVISLVGVIATIGFVISGFNFIAAVGDSGRAEKAKKGLMYSIIGVVVAGASLILLKQVLILLGMNV